METVVKNLLASHLQCTPEDNRPIVLMTCGIAGSGKTTLAKATEAACPTFNRLSIDEIVHQSHGKVDYEASSKVYAQHLADADPIYLANFRALIARKKNVILERSFYAKEDREMYRKIARDNGARVVLVFLKVEGDEGKEMLWSRICKRGEGVRTANSAVDIGRDTFEMYWNGFEDPEGEGEIVVRVDQL